MEIRSDAEQEVSHFESYFRDPAAASESVLAWALAQRLGLIEALRALFSGPTPLVQLRLWCFLELASVPHGRISRDDLSRLFYALQPAALEAVLKRFREAGLLVWDATAQDYALSPLAQQLHGLLAPLTQTHSEDDDLAGLLAQVAGAHALGLTDPTQLRHLHAQLARLHDEFADAITSGSEARLRQVQPRFERALSLVDKAGHVLTALIRAGSDNPRLEKEARALGSAQARLLAMASQFNRALQQADRQRVTLGSTGVTSSDVRQWLQTQTDLHRLLEAALSTGVAPVFVSQHDLLDVAEAEFERDRPDPQRSTGLPPPVAAGSGELSVPSMPAELHQFLDRLAQWQTSRPTEGDAAGEVRQPLQAAVLGGRFAQAAYRMQLLPLLGDPQASALQGLTGQLARSGWRSELQASLCTPEDPEVQALSEGQLIWSAPTSSTQTS